MTPADVQNGRTAAVLAKRAEILTATYSQYPHRFVKGAPLFTSAVSLPSKLIQCP